MSFTRRDMLGLAGITLAAPFLARRAIADAWPDRPVRVIVPFSAGSTTDVIGRLVLDQVSKQVGQPFVIENRGGAGGTIGSLSALQAPADGYMLLVHSAGHSSVPAVYPKAKYDPASDFSGIASFGSVPNVLVVSPQQNIKSVADLVAAGQRRELTFASSGAGSASHWGAERFRLAAGLRVTHVPFRGGPEALTEVIAGRVDFMSAGASSTLPLISDGLLLPLAVSTPARSSSLPDVPTMAQVGYKDADYIFWNGLLASSKTPRPIIEMLHSEVQKALASASVREKLAAQSTEPMPVTPAEFDAVIKSEIEANLTLVQAAGLKFN